MNKKQLPNTDYCLLAKLLPPRSVRNLVPREKLLKKLSENESNPVIVVAEAGYGKTTLIADFVKNSGKNFVWYQLDETDSDISTFFSYLVQGIRRIIPRFGEKTIEYIKNASEEISLLPERVTDLFLNEILESVNVPLYIVLDDYHHLGMNSSVHKVVSRLLKYSSGELIFLITTRELPPFSTSKLDSSSLLITTEDLAFNEEEIKLLFKSHLGLEPEGISICKQVTEGWATALQLILQVAQQERDPEFDLEKILQKAQKGIFQYFAEEVFTKESPDTQRALIFLSLFKDGLLDFCSSVFPDIKTEACLREIEKRSIFVTSVEGEEKYYRIHPLFRVFLQHRLCKDFGDQFFKECIRKIAEFFCQEKRWEVALEYFLQAGEFEKVADILGQIGNGWLESGKILLLDNFISSLPTETLSEHPNLFLQRAEVCRLQGRMEEALSLLRKAKRLFSEKRDLSGIAETLCSAASVLRKQARIEATLRTLQELDQLLLEANREHLKKVLMKAENTRGLCFISLGEWKKAQECFRKSLKLAEEIEDEKFIKMTLHNLALPFAFKGDFGEALRWFGKIFSESDMFPQQAIGHLNIARLHIFRGELTEAESHLNKSLQICNNFNLKDLLAEVFEAFGNIHRQRGDYQKALDFYAKAKKMYLDLGLDPSSRNLIEEEARLYLLVGWHSKAKALLEKLIEQRKEKGNELSIKTAELLLCYTRAAQKDFKNLTKEVCKLATFFKQKELHYDETQALILLSRIYFAEGKKGESFESLKKALSLVEKFDYEYLLLSEVRANQEFFTDPQIRQLLPDAFLQDLKTVSIHISESQSEIGVFDLSIRTFGVIEAKRFASKPIPSKAWITKRARDIFFFIATSKNRRALKDTLIENFWENENLETIEKNFHPTISHIRKALNWGQNLKISFLVFSDGAYQLNPEVSFWIDTEEFEKMIVQASKARSEGNLEEMFESLNQAAKIYAGEFMPGVYENWAEERRIHFEEQYVKVLSSLAKLCFSKKDFALAIKYAEQALQKDPLREDIYRILIKIYALQGKKALAIKCFNQLKEILEKELGVAPSPETEKLFRELTS